MCERKKVSSPEEITIRIISEQPFQEDKIYLFEITWGHNVQIQQTGKDSSIWDSGAAQDLYNAVV